MDIGSAVAAVAVTGLNSCASGEASVLWTRSIIFERILGLPEFQRGETKSLRSVETSPNVEEARCRRRLAKIEAVWQEAQALSKVPSTDPVKLYLASRGLYGRSIGELRSHPLLDYWEELDDGDKSHERWPAMLALVTDDDGRIVTLHRTYLTPDGAKAPVECPKKLYAGGTAAASSGLGSLETFLASPRALKRRYRQERFSKCLFGAR